MHLSLWFYERTNGIGVTNRAIIEFIHGTKIANLWNPLKVGPHYEEGFI